MKEKAITVQSVISGSIADEAGIEAGDEILSINGEKIEDIFDYRFLITNESLLVEVLKVDNEVWDIEIDKDEYEDLGIEFENSMLDDAKNCKNKCIFCFIDQLPEGMRETLYFKDDDSRLSFLTGNYVTLTNMGIKDIDRIVRYRMSPINISVHTTNPELRVFMLKNKYAGDVLSKIKRLVEGGITVNCQIVLCRDVNDGKELDRTISDLTCLYPGVNSISVVPVGITKYRENLCKLEPYNRDTSIEVVNQVGKWQDRLLEKSGSRVVYLADEFYIMAGVELPEYEHYEDFPQLENGVGLISLLKHDFFEYLEQVRNFAVDRQRNVSIATGVSAARYIRELAGILETRFEGIKINVYEIKNIFFGKNVTVTGLLTGRDIVEQLKGQELGDELFISRYMLKSGERLFLDDMTVEMLESELKVKITAIGSSGEEFINKILGRGDFGV